MYCARSEAQAFVDSAALSAALHLNGTTQGVLDAVAVATTEPDQRKQWQFSTASFTEMHVEFSQSAGSGFLEPAAVPNPPAHFKFARVSTRVNVNLTLLRPFADAASSWVAASAVAGQIKRETIADGVFPFSPMAPNPDAVSDDMDTWGFEEGQLYTLQWASTPDLSKPNTVCPGDATPEMLDRFYVDKNNRGFIVNGASAAEIQEIILNGTHNYPISEGDSLMTYGTKETETKYVGDLSDRDKDADSTYWSYFKPGDSHEPATGNNLRLVYVPVNSGPPSRIILGFAAFLLQPSSAYNLGGNKPMCGWFVGGHVFNGPGGAVENEVVWIALVR